MYKRIKNAIMNPKGLAEYANDKLIIAIVYLIIFTMLLSVPYIASLRNLDTALIRNFRESVTINEVVEYKIENHQLVSLNGDNPIYEFTMESINPLFKTYLIIGKELDQETLDKHQLDYVLYYGEKGVTLFLAGQSIGTFLAEYQYDANLTGLKDNEPVAMQAFYGMAGYYINQHWGIIYGVGIPLIMIYAFSQVMFVLLLVSLLNRIVHRRLKVNFGKCMKISIYALLPVVVCLMFSLFLSGTVFGSLIYLGGFVITVIFSSVAIIEYARNNFEQPSEEQ